MSSASSAADGSAWMTPARRARSFSFSIFPLWDSTGTAWGQPYLRLGGILGTALPKKGVPRELQRWQGGGMGQGKPPQGWHRAWLQPCTKHLCARGD